MVRQAPKRQFLDYSGLFRFNGGDVTGWKMSVKGGYIMKVERKNEEYGSFEVEFSEKFEEQLRKAAKEMVIFAKKAPGETEAEVEKLMVDYQGFIESSVSLLLSVIGLAFFRPRLLNYVINTLQACLEPLAGNLEREAGLQS